ncbi:MAG: isochorismatase family protein [Acidimicrobiales bacterium]
MAAYDPATALVVVDVQNDFADPEGSLFVAGAPAVVEAVNAEVGWASEGDAPALVVYTQDWHPRHTPHFQVDGGVWPVHCVAGTWGAELHPGLSVVAGSEMVRKGVGGEDGYSAFSVRDPTTGEVSPTGLAAVLERRGVARVVVVGLATDYCVRETALDATRLGLRTTVVRGAVAAVDLAPGDGGRALYELAAAGVHLE